MARTWKKTEAEMDRKQREKPGEDKPVKTTKSSDERARGRYGEGK